MRYSAENGSDMSSECHQKIAFFCVPVLKVFDANGAPCSLRFLTFDGEFVTLPEEPADPASNYLPRVRLVAVQPDHPAYGTETERREVKDLIFPSPSAHATRPSRGTSSGGCAMPPKAQGVDTPRARPT
jgi:hypothetical protein